MLGEAGYHMLQLWMVRHPSALPPGSWIIFFSCGFEGRCTPAAPCALPTPELLPHTGRGWLNFAWSSARLPGRASGSEVLNALVLYLCT